MFLSRLCDVRFEYVTNVTRDISEMTMAFQTLATFTYIVQSNQSFIKHYFARFIKCKTRFNEHAHKSLFCEMLIPVRYRCFRNGKRSHDKINASRYANQPHTVSINAERKQ